jgi:3-deoxy-D-manno-octulosonic-acid transferase
LFRREIETMVFLYNFGILLYHFGIWLVSFFNAKARLWLQGRQHLFETLENQSFIKKNKSSKIVWMHVASLGEFEQGRPLIESLKKKDPEKYQIVLSFFSPSGYELRKNDPLADFVTYLPLDTAANASRFLNRIQPDIAIFVKYEFWFHHLNELKKRKIPTLLIAAVFRPDQIFFRPYGLFFKKLLTNHYFDQIFVQNEASLTLLQKIGCQNVILAGDTRIDRVTAIAAAAKAFPLIEQFVGKDNALVCGSTWEADETLIFNWLQNKGSSVFKKIIIAPHEIGKARIQQLQKRLPNQTICYTQLIDNQPIGNATILIIDNIGMLSALYRYGKVAYIGGGFGQGIHNILEPAAFGLPILFGTNYQKFVEANALIAAEGAFSVQNLEQFAEKMTFLETAQHWNRASSIVQQYLNQNRGATILIADYLKTL